MRVVSPMPSSLTTTATPSDGTQQHILIASIVGVAVILVMIFLCVLYCYNRQNPMAGPFRHESDSNRNTPDSVYVMEHPPVNVYENKTLQYGDIDGSGNSYDVSIKLKTLWDELYGYMESEKFKTLRDQLLESVEDLYKHYCEFRGAILLRLRQGSVIADIRLNFSIIAVEPLNVIRNAVTQGWWCQSVEVQSDFFVLEENWMRQSRSDKTESGYGSQDFEQISFVEKNEEKSSLKFATNSRMQPSNLVLSTAEVKADTFFERNSSSSQNSSKNKNSHRNDIGYQNDVRHVACFNFSPQDDRELALQQGEIVHIKCIHPDGWAKVVNEFGKEGWVPRNFISEIDPQDYVNTKKAVESIIFLDKVIESADDVCDFKKSGDLTQELNVSDNLYENIHCNNVGFGKCSDGLFIAIFPFECSDRKELSLQVGDLIEVTKVSETGWWKGNCIRTNCVGWFPSTYVKPKSAEINFKTFFGDFVHKEPVSDSEIHSLKGKDVSIDLCSENTEIEGKDSFISQTLSNEDYMSCELEKVGNTEDFKQDNLPVNVEVESFSGIPPVPTKPAYKRSFSDTLSRNINKHVEHDGFYSACEPPAKPVPPKPRKLHMKQTYQKLFASDRIQSANELITRSMECLHNGHNSEVIFTPTDDMQGNFMLRPIQRARPLSCQSTTRFLRLSNCFASHMKSWSLPSLNGDQVKLSPDDDRPYLEPIPRKNKASPEDLEELAKIHVIDTGYTNEYLERNEPNIKSKVKATGEPSETSDIDTKHIDVCAMSVHDSFQCGFSVNNICKIEEKQKQVSHNFSISNECNNKLPACMDQDKWKEKSSCLNRNANYDSESKNMKYHTHIDTIEISPNKVEENHKLPCRILNLCGDESDITSYTFSVASFHPSAASSGRTMTSTKYEQMNLRRTVKSVCGHGEHDLSFDVGALLYELRPRNKEGLCYGLLEDSTQGWYPSECVESFQQQSF